MKQEHSEKQRAMEGVVSDIEKAFGKGSIMRYGEATIEPIDVIPSGSLALVEALGTGG